MDFLFNFMNTEDTKINNEEVVSEKESTEIPDENKAVENSAEPSAKPKNKEFKKNPRRAVRKEGRVKSEFDQKIVSIRRVTRVVAGGRRFSFSVTLVAGNRKGKVGVGQGKAGDTPIAIDKAMRNAKKNMIEVKLTKSASIPHDTSAKFGSSNVLIMPAPGRGILAGSSVRTVLELAGVNSVNAKILSGSKNSANIAKATIEALKEFSKTRKKIS